MSKKAVPILDTAALATSWVAMISKRKSENDVDVDEPTNKKARQDKETDEDEIKVRYTLPICMYPRHEHIWQFSIRYATTISGIQRPHSRPHRAAPTDGENHRHPTVPEIETHQADR